MKQWMKAQTVTDWLAAGLIGVMGLAVFLGVHFGLTPAEADNSYKQIVLRGKLLSSIAWSAAGSTDTVGSLFSTAAYDTTDFPNDIPTQSRSMRGPLVCWTMLDQLFSTGVTADSSAVSVFIQHAPENLESMYVNLMYLSSENRTTRGTGLTVGRASLDSQSRIVDSLGLAAVTDGAFGRYLRARFIITTQGGSGINRNTGVRAWVRCDLSGDSRIQ